ncbi:hypothetical protein SAMN05216474_2851 [Lishizhenia tianjinensis]|uniref:Uncharacterized protein n=1 Tax=Lishizhenia tianjinensis TaxID=477690 RepID=A0A1I7BKV4_9FLAO|nr:hypothetical protein [Lishizhenia tianjinensis]SFT87795.1 hypothetical protein SAMN05216474_2851 [Lishizhenia tianjinensis]
MKSLIVLLTALTFGYFNTDNHSISLQEAIDKGMVEAKFLSTGDYSGTSINIKIKWLKGRKVPLTITHGTQFLSEDEGDQDIFILEDQDIFVKSNEEETFPLIGYCCQASNSAPSENSSFKMSKASSKDLLSLADFCNGKRLDNHSKQAAIWAISDDHSLSDIHDIDNPIVKNLRKKVAEIKHVEDNWYSTVTEYEMDENRNISRQPVEVKGDLEYEFKRAGKLSYAVYDADDKLIKHLGDGLPITRPGSYSFGFNLKVEGWTPGKYSVKLSMNGNIIHAQAFEV